MPGSIRGRRYCNAKSALDARETGGSLHDKLGPLGAHAVVDAVAGWVAGTLEAHPQPAHGVTYAAKLTKAEARIDWSRSALEIDRQVRAFDPWPVAETTLGEEQVRIWEAKPVLTEALATHRPGDALATARAVAGRYRRRHARIAETAIARP